jgi:hypothetical protein
MSLNEPGVISSVLCAEDNGLVRAIILALASTLQV